jgi:sugar/nucleoside kinase (ribokinase family)
MLTLSVKGVILTRGERGASLFCNDKKHVVRNDVEGIKVDGPLDTTGCGDVFGAAFLLDYVRSSDMLAAVRFANGIAASKTKLFGCEDLQSLKNSFATA